MTTVYIILAVLLLIFILLIFPVKVYINYYDKIEITIRYIFFKFKQTGKPEKQEEKKRKKEKKKLKKDKEPKEKKESSLSKLKKENGIKGLIELFKEILKIFFKTAKKIIKHIYIEKIDLNIAVSSEDAAQTAILYGKINAYFYSVYALLSNFFNIKFKRINIYPDFLSEETKINFSMVVKTRPVFILMSAVALIFKFLVTTIKFKIKNNK